MKFPEIDPRSLFRYSLVGSAACHLLVGLCIAYFSLQSPIIDLDRNVIKTSLVSIGKPKPKEFLPRKIEKLVHVEPTKVDQKPAANPVPAKISGPAHVPVAIPKAKPAAKHMDFQKKLQNLTSKWSSNPSKAQVSRDELNGELAESYLERVQVLIQEAFVLPAVINNEDRKRLRLVLRFFIDGEGNLAGAKIERSSGSSVFDQAVMRAAKSVGSFGPPPLPLRAALQKKGETANFCPLECL